MKKRPSSSPIQTKTSPGKLATAPKEKKSSEKLQQLSTKRRSILKQAQKEILDSHFPQVTSVIDELKLNQSYKFSIDHPSIDSAVIQRTKEGYQLKIAQYSSKHFNYLKFKDSQSIKRFIGYGYLQKQINSDILFGIATDEGIRSSHLSSLKIDPTSVSISREKDKKTLKNISLTLNLPNKSINAAQIKLTPLLGYKVQAVIKLTSPDKKLNLTFKFTDTFNKTTSRIRKLLNETDTLAKVPNGFKKYLYFRNQLNLKHLTFIGFNRLFNYSKQRPGSRRRGIYFVRQGIKSALSPSFRKFVAAYQKAYPKHPIDDFSFIALNSSLRSLVASNRDQLLKPDFQKLAKALDVHPVKNYMDISYSLKNKEAQNPKNQFIFRRLRKFFPNLVRVHKGSFSAIDDLSHMLEHGIVDANSLSDSNLSKLKKFLDHFAAEVGMGLSSYDPTAITSMIPHLQHCIKPDTIRDIKILLKKGFIRADGIGDHLGNIVSFIQTPNHIEFLKLWRKAGFQYGLANDGKHFDTSEIHFLGRIAYERNVIQTLKDPNFIKFVKQARKKLRTKSDEMRSIHHLVDLYRILPKKNGKVDTAAVLNSKMLDAYRGYCYIAPPTFYLLYLTYLAENTFQPEKVKKLKESKLINHPIYATDRFLLNAIVNSPKELLPLLKNRQKLEKLAKPLGKPVLRTYKNKIGKPPYKTERPNLSTVRTLALIRIYMVKKAMKNPAFRKRMGELIYRDINDKTTEVGGKITFDQKSKKLSILSLASHASRDGAAQFRSTGFLQGGILGWHCHTLNENNSRFAGPSGARKGPKEFSGDLAGVTKDYGMTITSLGYTKDPQGRKVLRVNLDLYYVDTTVVPHKPVVIDIGTFTVPMPIEKIEKQG